MENKNLDVYTIIGRDDLIEKWIKHRMKEKQLITVSDIFLLEKIHKGKFYMKVPTGLKEVTGMIIVRPDPKTEGRYFLVRGWRFYHYAQKIGQEKVWAYVTHTGRWLFAKKLLRYDENVKE